MWVYPMQVYYPLPAMHIMQNVGENEKTINGI